MSIFDHFPFLKPAEPINPDNAFDAMMQSGLENNAVAKIVFTPAPKLSHNQAILRILAGRRGEWVSLAEISDYTARFCHTRCYPISTRVSNLRARGHAITNRTDNTGDVTKSEYKLEETK